MATAFWQLLLLLSLKLQRVTTQTIIPAGTLIDNSVEWKPADSPFVLQGGLSIENNGYLRILAGVKVSNVALEPLWLCPVASC